MSAYTLRIFDGSAVVGTLVWDRESDAFSLSYASKWVASKAAYPLSPHLPFSGQASTSTVRRFIENLLPEGRALDVASTHSNIQKNNVFGLIRLLGKETAGALSFLPEGELPGQMQPVLRDITAAELQERIDACNEIPFSVWDGKVRMSVAGYQDKLLVLVDGERIGLADGALSSTHILKPEAINRAMPYMVANEHYCMRLMSRITTRHFKRDMVAPVEIRRVPSPVLLVRRFDRVGDSTRTRRLHIIDGCQAVDLPVALKYERNMGSGTDVQHIRDGMSFEKLMSTRAWLQKPAEGLRHLVAWAVSTLLLGNSDAHGKNISFFTGRAGLAVAPLYDLVSVAQYDGNMYEHDLAMAFGDIFSLKEIGAFALADFCVHTGIPRPYFARELSALCAAALAEARLQAGDPVYKGREVEFVNGTASFVEERAKVLLSMAPDIAKFNKDNF
ncbi:MAG: HipA domain-containing protein [Burkholderiaceae bacterium]|nr:HipA domain-containing protein [Burkholderiaceae bacterium]